MKLYLYVSQNVVVKSTHIVREKEVGYLKHFLVISTNISRTYTYH